MRILLWHVHGSWTTAFVQGDHQYLVPVLPDRGPDGRGRARTWDWPDTVTEHPPEELGDVDVDVVILQRPVELEHLAECWLRRRPGRDVPAIYVEHNCPQGEVTAMAHPAADRRDLTVAHVTFFNQLLWDTGSTPSRVIEHGVVDPGYRYRGDLAAAAVVINEPLRRGRVTGTDLVRRLQSSVPLDLFGMGTEAMGGTDLPQAALHHEMARRRLYAHTTRWTSLGLSLIEAMHLGMPVVALSTTEAPEAVPEEAGMVTNHWERYLGAVEELLADKERATEMGRAARRAAEARYSLSRFLADWDRLLEEVTR